MLFHFRLALMNIYFSILYKMFFELNTCVYFGAASELSVRLCHINRFSTEH